LQQSYISLEHVLAFFVRDAADAMRDNLRGCSVAIVDGAPAPAPVEEIGFLQLLLLLLLLLLDFEFPKLILIPPVPDPVPVPVATADLEHSWKAVALFENCEDPNFLAKYPPRGESSSCCCCLSWNLPRP